MIKSKKKAVKTVTKEKTLVEKCYEFAKTLNPSSRFSEITTGQQEMTFYPLNYQADKIVIKTCKTDKFTKIEGSILLKSECHIFLKIATENAAVLSAAERICIGILKGN